MADLATARILWEIWVDTREASRIIGHVFKSFLRLQRRMEVIKGTDLDSSDNMLHSGINPGLSAVVACDLYQPKSCIGRSGGG